MRVYHYLNATHGLQNIRQRRIKIATLDDLNDPFELLALELGNQQLRKAMEEARKVLAAYSGFLCFGRTWKNPVMWSHYAERHKGLCLGFDIPARLLTKINYSLDRLAIDLEKLKTPDELDAAAKHRIVFTKFSHWEYEQEMRMLLALPKPDTKNGLYFAKMSPEIRLKQVIVGPKSSVTRRALEDALRELSDEVECFKARLAFKTFSVVKQNVASLWR